VRLADGLAQETCTLDTRLSPAMHGPSRNVAPASRKSSIELTSATSSEPSRRPARAAPEPRA
jgi:hypothetical protein